MPRLLSCSHSARSRTISPPLALLPLRTSPLLLTVLRTPCQLSGMVSCCKSHSRTEAHHRCTSCEYQKPLFLENKVNQKGEQSSLKSPLLREGTHGPCMSQSSRCPDISCSGDEELGLRTIKDGQGHLHPTLVDNGTRDLIPNIDVGDWATKAGGLRTRREPLDE
ncbi:uncharacterized protein C8Q71DRAFT_376565 [Rhodofomes roseus]|uniref:Uncharacterized protein n=1 Tax=Rhodofomes roseus TaxID=34475 RepID=A0ABQ8K135_9APHY|nr:uncharacterized protein C8Q71DRAFT_376565 [Rhodofomes roseus]KAH9830363.1 hypothetical protein C8Q71DRAFT_376565 [Rhodofomes roseus]